MIRRFLVPILAVVLTTAAFTQSQVARTKETPLALLQGTWVFTAMDGQDLAAAGMEILVTITDNTYTQTVNGVIEERGTFKLDDTKKPMALDLSITEGNDAGQTQVGVVEVTATTVRAKLNAVGATVRPTDFEPAPAEGFLAFTAKKR